VDENGGHGATRKLLLLLLPLLPCCIVSLAVHVEVIGRPELAGRVLMADADVEAGLRAAADAGTDVAAGADVMHEEGVECDGVGEKRDDGRSGEGSSSCSAEPEVEAWWKLGSS